MSPNPWIFLHPFPECSTQQSLIKLQGIQQIVKLPILFLPTTPMHRKTQKVGRSQKGESPKLPTKNLGDVFFCLTQDAYLVVKSRKRYQIGPHDHVNTCYTGNIASHRCHSHQHNCRKKTIVQGPVFNCKGFFHNFAIPVKNGENLVGVICKFLIGFFSSTFLHFLGKTQTWTFYNSLGKNGLNFL